MEKSIYWKLLWIAGPLTLAWILISRSYEPLRTHFWLSALGGLGIGLAAGLVWGLIYWKLVRRRATQDPR
jgi:hypothetical protein